MGHTAGLSLAGASLRRPKTTRRLLGALAERPDIWVALISGRGLRDLKGKVRLQGLCYVGNHGLELEDPQLRHVNPLARRCRPLLGRIGRRLEATLKPIQGAWVEDKGPTLSVHYRQVPDDRALLVRDGFHEVLRPYLEKGAVRVTTGKRVFEVRPPVRWTKGTVVNWLIQRRAAVKGEVSMVPVYIGDDQTDEDTFEALGRRGITVTVGKTNPLTCARYRVENPREVQKFLRLVLRLRRRVAP